MQRIELLFDVYKPDPNCVLRHELCWTRAQALFDCSTTAWPLYTEAAAADHQHNQIGKLAKA